MKIMALAVSIALAVTMGCDLSGPYPASPQPPQPSAPSPDYHIPLTDEGDLAGGQHFYRYRDDKWNDSIICFAPKNRLGDVTTSLSCVKE